jgi:hypothetical protein
MINDAGKYQVKNFEPHRGTAAATAVRIAARGTIGGRGHRGAAMPMPPSRPQPARQ